MNKTGRGKLILEASKYMITYKGPFSVGKRPFIGGYRLLINKKRINTCF